MHVHRGLPANRCILKNTLYSRDMSTNPHGHTHTCIACSSFVHLCTLCSPLPPVYLHTSRSLPHSRLRVGHTRKGGRKLGHDGNIPEARIDIQTRHHHPGLPLSLFLLPSSSLPPLNPSLSRANPVAARAPFFPRKFSRCVCLFFPRPAWPPRKVNGPSGMSLATENQISPSTTCGESSPVGGEARAARERSRAEIKEATDASRKIRAVIMFKLGSSCTLATRGPPLPAADYSSPKFSRQLCRGTASDADLLINLNVCFIDMRLSSSMIQAAGPFERCLVAVEFSRTSLLSFLPFPL